MKKGTLVIQLRLLPVAITLGAASLPEEIEAGEIDPSFVVTHSRPLENGPELYKTFRDKEDGCIKVVLKP